MKVWDREALTALADLLDGAVYYLPPLGADAADAAAGLLNLQARFWREKGLGGPATIFIDIGKVFDACASIAGATCRSMFPLAGLAYSESSYAGLPQLADLVAERTNLVRAGLGLAPLVRNKTLDACALAHATYLARRGQLAHGGSDGRTPLERMLQAGYRAEACGENLAIGSHDPTEIVERWMESPSHRRNVANLALFDCGVAFAAVAADVHDRGERRNGVCVALLGRATQPAAQKVLP
jgi:hypothetical protein